ncbi:MAG: DNA translocase FtsK 4TM domain-containing protein [Rickettsiales bacterium]|nr:DNA translocase FtsK 4TM domain-containing protein [Rickettsiales bacterium]
MTKTNTRAAAIEPTRNPLRVLAGLGICLVAFYIFASLITYNPADPSLNHAAPNDPTNAGGYFGAVIANLSLQLMGLASALLVLVPLAWGAKMLCGHRVSFLWLRFSLMLASLACVSALLSTVEPPLSWPISSGFGGSIGATLHDNFYRLFKNAIFITSLSITTVVVLSLAFGISWREWRSVLRGAGNAAMFLVGMAIALTPSRRERNAEQDDEEDDTPSLRERLVEKLTFWRRNEDDDDEDEAAEIEDEPAPKAAKKREMRLTEKAPRPVPKAQAALALPQGDYELPPLKLLTAPPRGRSKNQLSESALTQNARLLESVLRDFGVNGEIVEIRPGPVVTLYELEPAAGTKSSRVIGLSDDIARSMSAISARIAVIPGRNAIGIELPNSTREMVYLREMLENEAFESADCKLPLALGKDIGGSAIITDLVRMPHLLVAGTTGSGKSVAINTMILSLVYRLTPDECKFIMIDPKMLELSVYEGIPHLLSPVVTEPGKAVVALKWTVKEMENRYRLMSHLGVRNIDGYNKKIREAKAKGHQLTRTVQTGFNPDTGEPIIEEVELEMIALPFIVVIVDEMADLMIVAGKDIEGSIQRLAQMARAAGIHIIMATQRPSVDVITGVIKANFPTRISFQVTSRIDSRTILGEQGAEQLLGQGDMLYMAGGGRITRVHGPFVSDKEVEQVVAHLKAQGSPTYIEDVTRDEEEEAAFGMDTAEKDELYDQAVSIVIRDRKASTSYVQRCLKIGYNRAASIIEMMERQGIVGPANHVGKREVLAQDADA